MTAPTTTVPAFTSEDLTKFITELETTSEETPMCIWGTGKRAAEQGIKPCEHAATWASAWHDCPDPYETPIRPALWCDKHWMLWQTMPVPAQCGCGRVFFSLSDVLGNAWRI